MRLTGWINTKNSTWFPCKHVRSCSFANTALFLAVQMQGDRLVPMGSIGFSQIGSGGLRRIQMYSAGLRRVVTSSGSISGFLCIRMDPDEFRLVQMCSGRLRRGS